MQEAVDRIGYRISPAYLGRETVTEADDAQAGKQRFWLWRVLLAWPLSLAVTALALAAPEQTWARCAALALTVPVQFVAGQPILKAAVERARHRSVNVDSLVAVGTLAAFLVSAYQLAAGGRPRFETAALIMAFILLGRYLETRVCGRASAAIPKLLELGTRQTLLIEDGMEDGTERPAPVEQIWVSDLAQVGPGEKITVVGHVLVAVGAAATFALWWLLIVACPSAVGTAARTAVVVATSSGIERGVLVKSGRALEASRHVRTIVFSKTGTLTNGEMALTDLRPAPGQDPDELLVLAAAAEAGSEHPIGRAIAAAAAERGLNVPQAVMFVNVAGHGVRTQINGRRVAVGRRKLMAEDGLPLVGEAERDASEIEAVGRTAVLVGWDGQVRGVIGVADTVRDGAAEVVAELRRMGLQVLMVTGDNARTAGAFAEQVGVDRVVAEVLPVDKATEVRRLQEAGEVVAMVGDGIDDAPALVQADLGIAVSAGTGVAVEPSDIALTSRDLEGVVLAIRLSRRTVRTIYQNLGWAFGYHAATIPLASAGLLHPVLAAAATAFSSVGMVSNSLRLRSFRASPSTTLWMTVVRPGIAERWGGR